MSRGWKIFGALTIVWIGWHLPELGAIGWWL